MSDYVIQSVLLNKHKYSLKQAKEFLLKNGYVFKKVDVTTNYLRCRQVSPKTIEKQGFKQYRIKDITPDILLVIAYK